MNYKTWLDKTVTGKLSKNRKNFVKNAAKEDLTLPVLDSLINEGYEVVQWDAGNSTHSKCLDLHGQQWPLVDFISGLSYSAPMAEKSHPNDANCKLIVSGVEVPTVSVDYSGNVEQYV